ncbi:ASCH domain-containing protein [Mycolicibacterium llatzerense]|uniref:ASCH domain-containing protein n=1 Tax=Mycolicibacterium llatzerense TaxID=280871 RepID=UPI0021B60FB0|nr:ASCH domain-containing protein [Mycolicibacterium llatzerense]MCT7372666.1 hypothetical protein [Mycolicibacterium llatzerense]
MTTIRALTVQQPWAWAIVNGDKQTENRTQAWAYRGPLLIHAGTRWSGRGGNSPLIREAFTVTNHGYKGGNVPEWLFNAAAAESIPGTAMGAIIGIVDLVAAHPDAGCCRPWGESSYTEHGGHERRTITHLVLENARALPEPIACRGALGLWKPPPDIVEQLHHLDLLPAPVETP